MNAIVDSKTELLRLRAMERRLEEKIELHRAWARINTNSLVRETLRLSGCKKAIGQLTMTKSRMTL